MLPGTNTQFAVRPYALAYIVLHTLPDKWLRIDFQLLHVFDVEDPPVLLQVSVDG